MSAEPVDNLPSITVGALRQNPTSMIHDVRAGQSYVLTDRGVPTARIIPFRRSRWIPASQVRSLLQTDSFPQWAADIADVRQAESDRDPWESR
ncbi:MAG: type II toxin-antitoxin system prevent-host-death family antitoxin [Propionibacteriaceae bacterium]|jgi:prevent-host-death family protein|nr:type II toxin-antitoxin system prevent-host-death family antitoxin [Propionibacteriaceae bacterium]